MLFAAPVMLIFPPAPLACVPAPVMLPVLVITCPPSFSVPAVSASVVSTLQLFPSVAEKPALFIVKVAILSVVPGVVGLKNNVPRSLAELIVKFELAPFPVRYCVADIPDTVPFSVNVLAPRVHVLLAPVNVSPPFTVGLPVKVNALADAALNSRLPRFAPEMLFAIPVILILPLPLLACVPAPAMLPEQVITLPPSTSVPVSVNVVLTLRLLPSVVVPALTVTAEKLFEVPGTV